MQFVKWVERQDVLLDGPFEQQLDAGHPPLDGGFFQATSVAQMTDVAQQDVAVHVLQSLNSQEVVTSGVGVRRCVFN